MMLRLALGAVGLLAMTFGGVLLLGLGAHDLGAAIVWLVAGVLVHDVFFAPVVLVVGVLGASLLPPRTRGPLVVGGIVLVTVTLAVAPTLMGIGAEPDNPSLLDRSYGLGWMLFAGIVVSGVVLGLVRERRRNRPDPPPG